MQADQSKQYLSYRLFSFIWIVFMASHIIITLPEWIGKITSGSNNLSLFAMLWGFLILGMAFISLCYPKKVIFFIITICLFCTLKLAILPTVPNHIFVSLIINATILFSLVFYIFSLPNDENRIVEWFGKLVPYLRLELIIIYFFAVLHKLNYDYFNPEISCGRELYYSIVMKYPFLPFNSFFIHLAIFGAVFLEFLIPLLLLIKGTRMLGIVIGVVFHFILSFHPVTHIIVFTIKMYALFTLFMPDDTLVKLKVLFVSYFGSNSNFLKKAALFFSITGLIIFISLTLFYFENSFFINLQNTRVGMLYIFELIVLIIFAIMYFYPHNEAIYGFLNFSKKYAFLAFLLLTLMLNGFAPYMGFKTITTLSMFSNLYVENNKNNHFFIPSASLFHNYQKEIVTLIESDHLELKEMINKKQRYINLEFQRFLYKNRTKTFNVKYEMNQKIYALSFPKDFDGSYWNNTSFFVKKLIMFRPLPAENAPCMCQW